jgi:hypothetical protein
MKDGTTNNVQNCDYLIGKLMHYIYSTLRELMRLWRIQTYTGLLVLEVAHTSNGYPGSKYKWSLPTCMALGVP